MSLVALEIFGSTLYISILIYTWLKLSKSEQLGHYLPFILLFSIVLHGYISYLNIDGGNGQNYGLFNIFAMTTWIAMIVVYWNLIRHQAYALLLFSLPIAAISLLEVAVFGGSTQHTTPQSAVNIWHILLGISAMSILLLAALQSFLVLYIDNGLRHHPASIHPWLGPLQSMERYLFQLLLIGFLLMSLSLGLSIFNTNEASSNQALHKIVLTLLSWLVLAVLLFGHYKKGWHGVYAAKWTLVGVFLLLLGYFGSKLVLEFLIQQ